MPIREWMDLVSQLAIPLVILIIILAAARSACQCTNRLSRVPKRDLTWPS